MKTIKLTIEYVGTCYVGWQIQNNGISVQKEVETALEKILGHPIRINSSGRTDAGVHAFGMVAHFKTDRDLPLSAFREGTNHYLPEDIAIQEATFAEPNFHARYSARGKWYRYTIWQAPVRSPLNHPFCWHIRRPLDLGAMRKAAESFVGTHDFAAFRSSSCAARTTIREIFSVEIVPQNKRIIIEVKGSGFLKNMVRMMVGALVEIGLEKKPVSEIETMFRSGKTPGAGRTAPPQGLCLMEVWY